MCTWKYLQGNAQGGFGEQEMEASSGGGAFCVHCCAKPLPCGCLYQGV